jgi:7-cyano-7-deazaguanine synthase
LRLRRESRQQVSSGKSIKPRPSPPDVWVLLSGGIDSSACLEFYKAQRVGLFGFFVDYGQAAAPAERAAARKISGYYRVPLKEAKWLGSRASGPGLIQGRNALLVFAALLEHGDQPGLIAIGIHRGTAYYDCSPGFFGRIRSVVASYTDGRVRLAAPFLRWTKGRIVEFCRSREVPLNLTYSCEKGRQSPCNKCLSCQDRKVLHVV